MPPYSPPPPPVNEENNAEPLWVNSKEDDEEEEEEEEEEYEEEDDDEYEDDDDDEEEDDDDDEDEDDDDDDGNDWAEDSERDQLLASDWDEEQQNRKNSNNNKRGKKNTLPKNRRPLRNCCHSFFILIQMIAVLVNLAMIGVQVVPIFAWKSIILEQKVVRGFLAFFNLMFILAEFDVDCIGLKNWIKRGILYTFMGVMALDQRVSMIKFGFLNTKNDTSFSETWDELWTSIIIEGTSWAMIGTGCVYFLLEIFCMRRVRNRCRVQYQKRVLQYKEKKQR